MFLVFLLLCGALGTSAYWYPNPFTRTPSPGKQAAFSPQTRYAHKLAEEGCYSDTWAPAWAICPHSADLLIVPCKNLWIPSKPNFANNFTYYSVCNYPYSDYVDTGFWSDIITVDVCENFWDACISDNPIAKYNDSLVYGNKTCRAVTDSACGPNRVVASSIPGSQPDDTTLGAFDLGPILRSLSLLRHLVMLRIHNLPHISLVCLLFPSLRRGEVWDHQPDGFSVDDFKCDK
jgi:hypothetical protein